MECSPELASLHEAVRPLQLVPADGNRAKGPYTAALSLLIDQAGSALYDDALANAYGQATPINCVAARVATERGVRNFREAINLEVFEDGLWVADHRKHLHAFELGRLFTLLHRVIDVDGARLVPPALLLPAYATEAVLHAAMVYPDGPAKGFGRKDTYPFASYVSARDVAPYIATYTSLWRTLIGRVVRDNRRQPDAVSEILERKTAIKRQPKRIVS